MVQHWKIVTADGYEYGTYLNLERARAVLRVLKRDYQSFEYRIVEGS